MNLKDTILVWYHITPVVQEWHNTIAPKHPGQPQLPELIYDEEDEEP